MNSQQYFVTPWRSKEELLEVRQLVYDKYIEKHDINAGRTASKHIQAWTFRGNLPHAVESTGLLLEAQLNHCHEAERQQVVDTFTIRAAYTYALMRFVTGFADLGRSRSGPGQSMLEVAKDINLPAEFVEIRHEATHEGMPVFARLTKATSAALTWLYHTYWEKLDAAGDLSSGSVQTSLDDTIYRTNQKDLALHSQEQVQNILKEFRKSRKDEFRNSQQTGSSAIRDRASQLVALVSPLKRGHSMLAETLCAHGTILPSSPEASDAQMASAYWIWDDLLKEMSMQSRKFLKPFLECTISRLDKSRLHSQHRGLCCWIKHIFSDPGWMQLLDQRHQPLGRFAIQTCLLHPSDCTKTLCEELLQIMSKSAGHDFDDQAQLCASTFEDYDGESQIDSRTASKSGRHSKHLLRGAHVS